MSSDLEVDLEVDGLDETVVEGMVLMELLMER
jgi:hypothetical protein